MHRFELIEAETLEPKPGIPPSPGHILKVIGKMKEEKIGVVLMEVFYDEKPARLVAAKTGTEVVKVANSVGGTQEDYKRCKLWGQAYTLHFLFIRPLSN